MFSQFVFVLKNENHARYSSFDAREISVLIEIILRHLRFHLAGVRPSNTLHLTEFSAQINHSEAQR